MTVVTLATCNLNQWALDFEGNLKRILQSCVEAKQQGASYRLGPELEICGYGCEDHYLEVDTFTHCWESLSELFELGATDDLLCDFGMPVLYRGARYNCRVLCYNRKVLLVRPKVAMCDEGNYRESRYFVAWDPHTHTNNSQHQVVLPKDLFQDKFPQHSQTFAPFGSQHLQLQEGITIGCETCEELWTPRAQHIDMSLSGVEIIGNGSGSHHELRKLDRRLELIISATRKCGGVYLYSNQRGCDGSRMYYDGCSMIVCNGDILAQASQFSVLDVEVISATVDLEEVRSYRAARPSFAAQSSEIVKEYNNNQQLVYDDIPLPTREKHYGHLTHRQSLRLHTPEEECCLGPACWLWDFLRRSGASGYFLPLSGGADSSAVAAIVGAMTVMVTEAARVDPYGPVAQDCRRVCRMTDNNSWVPSSPQELANYILHTTFMGTDNSSQVTNDRARKLAESIGSYHLSISIDLMVSAVLKVFQLTTGKIPKYLSQGGTYSEDVALQNIQARLRMVTAYLFAQLLPWVRGRGGGGFLLVLGSANVDEGLRGYMTKYDCSSADLNPIGSISKKDLKSMLVWASKKYDNPALEEVANAPPTAELRPTDDKTGEHSQTDEEDMGMTYEELSFYGRLRKLSRCGPVSMFKRLTNLWSHLEPAVVAEKVKRFFYYYSVNRHKMTTITPAYHAEAYSPDDNRYDWRQFLYNTKWERQFQTIDRLVQLDESAGFNREKGENCHSKKE